MFSEKTKTLEERVKKILLINKFLSKNVEEKNKTPYDIVALKPKIDIREDRRDFPISWTKFSDPSEIYELSKDKDIIFCDEYSLLEEEGKNSAKIYQDYVDVFLELKRIGKNIIISALNLDYEGKPFEIVKSIFPYADEIKILKAICKKCGNPAGYTQRIINSKERILVGDKESYEARCFEHHFFKGYKK